MRRVNKNYIHSKNLFETNTRERNIHYLDRNFLLLSSFVHKVIALIPKSFWKIKGAVKCTLTQHDKNVCKHALTLPKCIENISASLLRMWCVKYSIELRWHWPYWNRIFHIIDKFMCTLLHFFVFSFQPTLGVKPTYRFISSAFHSFEYAHRETLEWYSHWCIEYLIKKSNPIQPNLTMINQTYCFDIRFKSWIPLEFM